ncbi:hydantoinase/oxoprolinase family protein [Desulfocicer niacini]
MGLTLGIDTGGTYTDAVVVDQNTQKIIAEAKSLTTKGNLFMGISSAISLCIKEMPKSFPPENIHMTCLSTTLATNAITEGHGASVCEILIGYNRDLLQKQGFMKEMIADDIIWLTGGHDLQGNEVAPLDEKMAKKLIEMRRDKVDVFAISGYFGIRNPDHELRVKKWVQQLTQLPVTCAHELTTRLNSITRAITVAHNARLIPLLKTLISDVRKSLKEFSIHGPLMIVKGDGGIVPAELAIQKPIETILSGPAASCVGAYHLTGQKDIWVADMGGTTTDIALLMNGRPAISPEGAYIGHRRTLVEAVDIHTVGLGGDSLVEIDARGNICIGPRRAIPLSLLAKKYPEIISDLKRQIYEEKWRKKSGQFMVSWISRVDGFQKEERELLNSIKKAPLALLSATQDRKGFISMKGIEQLENRCLLQRSAFTPTDALHVLDQMNQWNKEASNLGAHLLAKQAGMSVMAFCEALVKIFSKRLVRTLLSKVMVNDFLRPQWEKEPTAAAILDIALNDSPHGELACTFKLKKPLVAIGAPVNAYMPRVASGLNTKLIIPEHAHVANAYGAATASIIQRSRAVIRMMAGGKCFRAHLPDGIADFPDLEAAKNQVELQMKSYTIDLALKAGAGNIEVETTCSDHSGTLAAGQHQEKFLDTEIFVTVSGKPKWD